MEEKRILMERVIHVFEEEWDFTQYEHFVDARVLHYCNKDTLELCGMEKDVYIVMNTQHIFLTDYKSDRLIIEPSIWYDHLLFYMNIDRGSMGPVIDPLKMFMYLFRYYLCRINKDFLEGNWDFTNRDFFDPNQLDDFMMRRMPTERKQMLRDKQKAMVQKCFGDIALPDCLYYDINGTKCLMEDILKDYDIYTKASLASSKQWEPCLEALIESVRQERK